MPEQTDRSEMQQTRPIGNSISRVFPENSKLLGTPTVDLFAFRLCHQLSQYMAWKPYPNSFETDIIQQDWNQMFALAFPPFSLIGRVMNVVLLKSLETIILVTPTWQTQHWYSLLLRMSIKSPLLLPGLPNLLLNPQRKKQIKNRRLQIGLKQFDFLVF